MENIFIKIINRTVPADIVYETEHVLAFLDINPNKKGHTLVIPKSPVPTIHELSDRDAAPLMQALVTVANAVKEAVQAKGINIVSNNGEEAGQVVPHLHFHVIPRFSVSEFPKLIHESYENPEEQKHFADLIRTCIKKS